MKVTETTDNADINGIGGVAKGRVVELNLESRTGVKTIVIKATVVDEIMNLQKKHENRFSQLTKESADALKKKKGFEKVTKENFQQVPGGKIQMLLGQNIEQDFYPREIATFTCGLKISIHQIKFLTKNGIWDSVAFSHLTSQQCTQWMITQEH